ncbi:MAG: hypothetical protein ABH833_02565 [Parcubacteria group bacterium]
MNDKKNRICEINVPVNDKYWDGWSVLHVFVGVLLAWVMNPFIALFVMILYEPFEVRVICPWIYKRHGIVFGNESAKNILMDIMFDAIGILIGFYILRGVVNSPFILF